MKTATVDHKLLESFEREFKAKVPHLESARGITVVAEPTPLVEVTEDLVECARSEYGLRLGAGGRVFAKFDSEIFGGSVKVRPAAHIIEDAISSGRLVRGQIVFEATSGNFGLALGILRRLGLNVVVVVSRKLQPGVLEQLEKDDVRTINLDIDICPAPGMPGDANLLVAKGVAANVRQQLSDLGFDLGPFDTSRSEVERLLAGQDAIGLAKHLASIYRGFCPEQYDNELNADVHEKVTGPEIDQQLEPTGISFADVDFVCAFGTGGTATGISRYMRTRYGRSSVRVVFPLAGQDVGGIRTKEKASGLRFYQPDSYAREHEVDFEQARRVFAFFNQKGYDVGESGALALYACIQLLNYGAGEKFVVMIADGASKYVSAEEAAPREVRRDEVNLQEAASQIGGYAAVVWTHGMFVPREAGMQVIASSLGCDRSMIRVARPRDVQLFLGGGDVGELGGLIPGGDKKVLLVCMAGNTSLLVAKKLAKLGLRAESLTGGIGALPAARTRQPFELLQQG